MTSYDKISAYLMQPMDTIYEDSLISLLFSDKTTFIDKNWTSSHICIRKGNLLVYKDEKNLKEGSPLFEEPILNCEVAIDTEHKKKKNVFKFS